MSLRIGYGYDVHQLAEGEHLVIGGLTIPHHKGSVGHSDADVLLHVICDGHLAPCWAHSPWETSARTFPTRT